MISVIFIILNLVLAGGTVMFVKSSEDNAQVLEEVSAKQIASIINRAKSGTIILLDMKKESEVFANKVLDSNVEDVVDRGRLNEIVEIDNEENSIFVSLNGKEGYKTYYFSDYHVETDLQDGYYLRIKISDDENA